MPSNRISGPGSLAVAPSPANLRFASLLMAPGHTQPKRASTIENGFDEIRREQGKPQHPAHVSVRKRGVDHLLPFMN